MYNQNVFVFFSNQQKEIVSQSEGDQKVPRHSGALKTHKEPTHEPFDSDQSISINVIERSKVNNPAAFKH